MLTYGFDYVSFCGVDKASRKISHLKKKKKNPFSMNLDMSVHCRPVVLYQEKFQSSTIIRDADIWKRPLCGEVYCTVTKVAAMG